MAAGRELNVLGEEQNSNFISLVAGASTNHLARDHFSQFSFFFFAIVRQRLNA
jgi:hypothetical protein